VQSLVSVLAQRASETPDRMLINDIAGLDRTYRQLWDDALRWAGALRGLGVHRGDAVGLTLPPSSEGCAVQIACAVAGAVCVPLSPLLRGNPLTHALRACGVTTLITRDALLSGEQLAVCAKAATLKRAVLTDVADADYRAHRIDIRGRGQVLTGATPTHWAGTEMEPAQALILTSGTSGPPKPVRITYTALDSYAANVVNAPAEGWEPDSGYYSPWALCHALGFIALGTAVYRGQRLVLRDGVDLDSYWADIRRFDCHLAVAVSIAAALWKQPGPTITTIHSG
jgi:carnitine-CoA ligase